MGGPLVGAVDLKRTEDARRKKTPTKNNAQKKKQKILLS
jgi:hypothetical protein